MRDRWGRTAHLVIKQVIGNLHCDPDIILREFTPPGSLMNSCEAGRGGEGKGREGRSVEGWGREGKG